MSARDIQPDEGTSSYADFSEWSNRVKLSEAMRFTDVKEFDAWLNGNQFAPFFEEFRKEVIVPEQTEAAKKNKTQRPRGPDLRIVEIRMHAGERGGRAKFSINRLQLDKSKWDRIDHYAFVLFQVKQVNTYQEAGVFFGKGFDDVTVTRMVWRALKLKEATQAPALLARKAESKKGGKAATAQAGGAQSREGTPTSQPLTDTRGATPQPPEDAMVQPDTQIEVDSSGNISVTFNGNQIDFEVDENANAPPPADLGADDDNNTVYFGNSKALSNAERLIAKCAHKQFDLTDDFWKIVLIDLVLKAKGKPDLLNNLFMTPKRMNEMANAETALWHAQMRAWLKVIEETVSKDSIKEETIGLVPFDDEAMTKFDSQQKWFDNTLYQRQDIPEACVMLEIPWNGEKTVYRMSGMTLSKALQYWQPPAIKALIDFLQKRLMKGCILADVVGLGKTWVVICFLLHLINMRVKQSPDERKPAKPMLVVVPVHLMDQWITEFETVAKGQFDIYRYHGDHRVAAVGDETIVSGHLGKSHFLFNTDREQNARSVVITTYETLATRHGPGAQKADRINQGMSATQAQQISADLDPKWAKALDGCFEILVADEAHAIKNVRSQITRTLIWLACSFNCLMTGTPTPNGMPDMAGYYPLIEARNAEEWWSEESLKRMNVHHSCNPFDWPNHDEVAKLRMTEKAFRKFILPSSIPPDVQGARIAQVWRNCLIRRTNASRVPFDSPSTIGDCLPRIHSTVVNCRYTAEETIKHEVVEKDLLGKLIDKKAQTYSFSVHRKLGLLTSWLSLPGIDNVANLKTGNIEKYLNTKNFGRQIAKFARPDLNIDKDSENWDQLPAVVGALCDGSPKMRALLRNLRSQVIRDGHKAIVWCHVPAVSLYIQTLLKLLGIDSHVMTSHMTAAQRREVAQEFDRNPYKYKVLITPYGLACTGYNFQHSCWHLHCYEVSLNEGITAQAIGRNRRIGCPSDVVYVYLYYIQGTFDDRQMTNNMIKAMPQVFAELNREIFSGEGDSDKDVVCDIGQWTMVAGQLTRWEDRPNDGVTREVYSPYKLMVHLMVACKGQYVVLEDKDADITDAEDD